MEGRRSDHSRLEKKHHGKHTQPTMVFRGHLGNIPGFSRCTWIVMQRVQRILLSTAVNSFLGFPSVFFISPSLSMSSTSRGHRGVLSLPSPRYVPSFSGPPALSAFTWKLMKASMEASIASVEAVEASMDASVEFTSTEAFTEVTSTKLPRKLSWK